MSARTERIAAALNAISNRIADKDRSIQSLTETNNRLKDWINIPDWASLQGQTIAENTIVRSGLLCYRCKAEHTWALIRSPANLIYWQLSVDNLLEK